MSHRLDKPLKPLKPPIPPAAPPAAPAVAPPIILPTTLPSTVLTTAVTTITTGLRNSATTRSRSFLEPALPPSNKAVTIESDIPFLIASNSFWRSSLY